MPATSGSFERAQANGADVKLIDACERRVLEPPTTGLAALHSPRTAIVDYPAICGSLAREMKERGATVRTTGPRLALEDGTSIDADRLLVRAGLHRSPRTRRG